MEGRDEDVSCPSTGTSHSLYTSVSYFLFWHSWSGNLSRHDQIWRVPRTLAKFVEEEAVGCREEDKLAPTAFAFFSGLFVELGCCWEKKVCRCEQSCKGDRPACGFSFRCGLQPSKAARSLPLSVVVQVLFKITQILTTGTGSLWLQLCHFWLAESGLCLLLQVCVLSQLFTSNDQIWSPDYCGCVNSRSCVNPPAPRRLSASWMIK